MAPTKEMLKIAIKNKPKFVCIVPEKRREITTEGGLNLKNKTNLLFNIIRKLKNKKIRVSLFIEPRISDIEVAKKLGANCVELHTGKLCSLINNNKKIKKVYSNLKKAALYANSIGLEVHAGHGINNKSIYKISKIKYISELNIGHSIVSESLLKGLPKIINKYKKLIIR